MNTLYVILGPTGIGKTEMGIHVAHTLGCSVISCDSRQIYRELKIGTASPDERQLSAVKHYFIGTKSIADHYSAGQYECDAIPVIESEIALHGNALMVGGSMLYVDAVCRGIDDIPAIDPSVREEVHAIYEAEGIDGIRRRLKILDPQHYMEVDLKNAKRIMHAIEVCIMTGGTFSGLRTNRVKPRPFNIVKIGLTLSRQELYGRINARVLKMMEMGLEEEARTLYAYRHLNALNTVGYKELFDYFDGSCTLGFAVEKIQQNTRKYAKKQITWFKKDDTVRWFSPYDTAAVIDYVRETNA